MFKKALITSSILLLSATANANMEESYYVGLSVGQTDLDAADFDDGDSFAITGGYRFNRNFAVEASYFDLGSAEDDIAPVWTVDVDGFNFSAVGLLPVNETFEVFGKVGVFMWDLSLKEDGTGKIGSDDGTDLSYGVGAVANLTEQFSLTFEYMKLDIEDSDPSNISLGARYNF